MKNKWTKIVIGTSIAASIGVTGVFTGMKVAPQETQVASALPIERNIDLTQINESSSELIIQQVASKTREVEGKVVSYKNNSLKIAFPSGGAATYKITNRTRIEENSLRLRNGVLVEVKVSGKTALEIETERTIDYSGIIVSDSKTKMKVKYKGKNKTFHKSSRYYLDRDGYRGSIKGMPVELKLNNKFQIVSAELDDWDDDDYYY